MPISVFQIFKIGLGPSSSHTVGPMKAAHQFAQHLQARALLPKVRQVRTDLYGSLAATGKGHNTDRAVMLGLMGETPETVPIDAVEDMISQVKKTQKLSLMKSNPIQFVEREHIMFNFGKRLSYHTNGVKFTALGDNNEELFTKTFYSVGGGFIVDDATAAAGVDKARAEAKVHIPFPFTTGDQLLQHCEQLHIHVKDVMMANEVAIGERKSADEIVKGLDRIWAVMSDCVARGMTKEGTLPGELKVRRRAGKLLRDLTLTDGAPNPTANLDWINLFALAVNEENAVGGRVVTAPTNGAAGVIPAVLHYYFKFHHGLSNCKGRSLTPAADFLLTAGAIGIIFKENASIAGADMGCQGEVGVASSMAAAGLTALLGGTPKQVENAAEIAMEHHLGLTCDPVGGLVQIPCIERNTFGAVKAINSATLALHGDGNHTVSLDRVVRVMKQTGLDMKVKYKETSLGGLAAEFRNEARGKHKERVPKAPEPAPAVAGETCEVDLVHQDNVATAEC